MQTPAFSGRFCLYFYDSKFGEIICQVCLAHKWLFLCYLCRLVRKGGLDKDCTNWLHVNSGYVARPSAVDHSTSPPLSGDKGLSQISSRCCAKTFSIHHFVGQ